MRETERGSEGVKEGERWKEGAREGEVGKERGKEGGRERQREKEREGGRETDGEIEIYMYRERERRRRNFQSLILSGLYLGPTHQSLFFFFLKTTVSELSLISTGRVCFSTIVNI